MAAKKTRKKPATKDKALTVVQCKAHEGKTPCLQRGLAAEILMEAIASIVWNHREDATQNIEFVVVDSGIVPSGKPNGHFEIGVSVARLDKGTYDEEDNIDLTLHKFLQTFVPTRTINAQDCQA